MSSGPLATMKELLLILIGSAIFAAIVSWLTGVAGLLEGVPPTELRSIGTTLAPIWIVGTVVFVLAAFVSILYVFFADQISEKVTQTREQWSNLPAIARALIAGLPFTIVAAVSVVLTDLLAYQLSVSVRLVVPLVVWLLVTVVCFRHLRAADTLAGLFRLLVIGSVVGGALAIGSILLDRVTPTVTLAGYVPLVLLLVGSLIVTTLIVRSVQREDGGALSKLLVKTGFAQIRQLQTVTVAIGVGLLFAAVTGLLVSFIIDGLVPIVLSFVVVWLVTSYLAFRWYQRTAVAHSDLVIVDVQDRSSGSRRELAVTNERDQRVDLRNAKIRDTEYDLYRTNIEVILAPGQTEKFDIPPEFALFPSTDDLAVDLPLGFSLSQRADAPIIVTRDGEKFKLRWGDGVIETSGGDSTPQPGNRPGDTDGMEENA